jgi:glycosyltransferase involved in cell wall biosynthesis
MNILMICKYPPIQGGVSAENYWLAQQLAENGHTISVVTNANEVEDKFKIELSNEDKDKLTGFRLEESIKIYSTEVDPAHMFIPHNNPIVTKLVSSALIAIKNSKPELIYSSYLEPYGVVAFIVSMMTNIPFTFKHAGSDIGRLLKSNTLAPLYTEVLQNASVILTSPLHHELFEKLGVEKHRMIENVSVRMPGDVFYPEDRKTNDRFVIGVYGKTGKAKGTYKLLKALVELKKQGYSFLLRAHWAGRDIEKIKEKVSEYELDNFVEILPYTAPWNIPSFIRSCDCIVALENHFSVTFHTPSLPLEVWSCGRHILMTEEVAQKTYIKPYVKNEENCLVIQNNFDVNTLVNAIIRMKEITSASTKHVEALDASLFSFYYPEQTENLFDKITSLLK